MINENVKEVNKSSVISIEEVNFSTHRFIKPIKKIEDGDDVHFFKRSKAFSDVASFILLLNISMFPRRSNTQGDSELRSCVLGVEDVYSSSVMVMNLRALLKRLRDHISEVPPDTGPRRFGNVSFRKWYAAIQDKSLELLKEHLPNIVKGPEQEGEGITAADELNSYFMGSFGSPERLDYGTGHELNFIAFLAGIWKLGGFQNTSQGDEERAIVIGVFEPYLQLIRELIMTYTIEPAGSHGVWGLDDHFFLPYLFGSAQLSKAIDATGQMPTEGSLPGAPAPTDIVKSDVVSRESKRNMYFSAIGFIYEVKKGPFWEHSPILYDISGVKAGWAKINKGMIKMYIAEVLSKFPVVQHFLFGSLFRWELFPDSEDITKTLHMSSQPGKDLSTGKLDTDVRDQQGININSTALNQENIASAQPQTATLTKAPWANTNQAALPALSRPVAYANSQQHLRQADTRK